MHVLIYKINLYTTLMHCTSLWNYWDYYGSFFKF